MKRLVFCAAFAAMVGYGTTAMAIPIVEFVPGPSLTVSGGDALSVDVRVSGLGGEIVSAYDLDILYDAALLAPTGVTYGLGLGDPFFFEVLEQPFPSLFNAPGLLDIAAISLLPDADLLALQGGDMVTLASLEFLALGSGTTGLSFDFGPGQDIKGANAAVIIDSAPTPVPEPSTLLLLGSGFGLWATIRKRLNV